MVRSALIPDEARYSETPDVIFHLPLHPKMRKCCCRCIMFTFIMIAIIWIAAYLAVHRKPINIIFIEINNNTTFTTNSKFLSVALDSAEIARRLKDFDIENEKLVKLMAALSPGYLRIGGTMADRLIFSADNNKSNQTTEFVDDNIMQNFTMTGNEWLRLNQLANATGLRILFDLNALRRFDNGSWDSRNAKELIEYSDRHQMNLDWELGNEPNSFWHKFNYSVNASQLATDFQILKGILSKYPRYKEKCLLVGPDTTRPQVDKKNSELYLEQFVQNAGHVVDAITWHHYYFDGRTAVAADFQNTSIFNVLAWQIAEVKRIANGTGKPIWLGETSSAWGGGAPGLSNKFIASFIWLDKMGLAAKMGIDLVIRQSIFRDYYALIDDNYDPTPDWWISVLYKRLVGPKVVSCYTISKLSSIRFYCQCSTKDGGGGGVDRQNNITVFGMNLGNTNVNIDIEEITSSKENAFNTPGITTDIYAYILTATDLLSNKVLLNDNLLELTSSNDVPFFMPKIVPTGFGVDMPPHSIVFWVISTGNSTVCVDS